MKSYLLVVLILILLIFWMMSRMVLLGARIALMAAGIAPVSPLPALQPPSSGGRPVRFDFFAIIVSAAEARLMQAAGMRYDGEIRDFRAVALCLQAPEAGQ